MSSGAAVKILLHGLNYAPEEIGIGPYTTGLAEHLAAAGHSVSVIAGRPYYPAWRAWPGSSVGWTRRIENGVEVVRCPHFIPRNPSAWGRILHHVTFALSSLVPVLARARRRPDIVIAIVPSMIASMVALAGARLGNAKLWLHVQDLEADAALATGIAKRGSLLARAGLALQVFILSRADLVTTISPQMERRLAQGTGGRARLASLRNWANHLDAIAEANADDLRRDWNLEGQFVALYSGNLGRKQGLETVIDAARLLRSNANISIIICGEGPSRTALEERAHDLANIRFLPLQPADDFARLMRLADCHLLPQIADAADLVLPSKLPNMLGSGAPVVATVAAGTGVADELEDCGIIVPPGDAAALAQAIARLDADSALRARLGTNARERARTRWTREAVLADATRAVKLLARAS